MAEMSAFAGKDTITVQDVMRFLGRSKSSARRLLSHLEAD